MEALDGLPPVKSCSVLAEQAVKAASQTIISARASTPEPIVGEIEELNTTMVTIQDELTQPAHQHCTRFNRHSTVVSVL